MNNVRTVAVALGSNLGDRDAHLDFAVDRLSRMLASLRASRRYTTAPVGVAGTQPDFLNMAVVGQADLPASDLLDALLVMEAERGRERPYPNAARTLDLDLILVGDLVLETPTVMLPHPRFRERRFVLEPLAEIAPELVDPVSGMTVAALLSRLPQAP